MILSFPYIGEASSALCAVVWAAAVVLFRKSGDHFPPVALNLFKGLVGFVLALATMPIAGAEYWPAVPSVDWLVLLASGALGIGVADTLFFASLNRIGAGRSAIVDSLYSPSVILWSYLLLDEPIGPALLAAVALMGAATFIGSWRPEEASRRPGGRREAWFGVGLGVAAIGVMAFGIVLAKPVLDRTDPWWATTVRLAGGLAFLIPQSLLPAHRAATIRALTPGPAWRLALPAAVLGAWLSMFLWVIGMKFSYTTIASVLNQTSNVWLILFAAAFLREPLHARHYLAVAMGFAAGWLAIAA